MSPNDKHTQQPPKPSTSEPPVYRRTLWQSYAALPAQTRLRLSIGLFAFAAVGLYVSDRLEDSIPAANPAPQSKDNA
ncbi:uncharacterized protein STEHIDRAFT_160170 [Stereum hirsutum FP-91666 SS1]|uniref:uncharacterized protein n=1 Tax=Stereum hirsutum (strain FP-91666) TaxID=721885 RepID=UPI0004449C9B|nr:uncharacterized protein STEHIDRAFT_160170 [Stereum hirsutum FP-91666 SS1]EIM83592.1 hypothetical protein STEHIDRAFT_160170 [Stereum hirsutum FP-91666 SS1]